MIKFFRKIRQNLLSEGKSGKYLKYAFGEVVLVVVGILIALQINNWNTNRIERNLEFQYLESLKTDIISQIQFLDVYIYFEDIIIEHSVDIIKHFELNDGFKNMDSIFPKLHDLSVRWTFSNANSTLLQMLNSNQINIIQNKQLKEELIKYNQVIEEFLKNTNNNNTNLIDNFLTQSFIEFGSYATYGHSNRMKQHLNDFYPFAINIVSDSNLKNISAEILDEPKNKLELINKVVFRNTLANLQKSGNQSLKEKSRQILLMIEAEVELNK